MKIVIQRKHDLHYVAGQQWVETPESGAEFPSVESAEELIATKELADCRVMGLLPGSKYLIPLASPAMQKGVPVKAPMPRNESARLKALAEYEILDSADERIYDDIVFLASSICETPISTVTLVDKDRQWFKSKLGLTDRETPRDPSFCAFAVAEVKPLIIPDAELDERFAQNPFVTGAPSIRFYAGVPLVNSEGFALGTLCVIDRKPKQLTEMQRQALEALGRQVMTLLETRRVAGKLAQEIARVKTLHGLLPICSFCKGIRDDKGYWVKVEDYLRSHSDASFSHGICQACAQKHYPQLTELKRDRLG